jgi:hypothetical protein
MTWTANLLISDALLLVLIGLALILGELRYRGPHVHVMVYPPRPRPRVTARQLGLAHRLGARLIRSQVRPADENFVAVAELYNNSGIRIASVWSPQLARYLEPIGPLCAVEDLLERMESFSARLRRGRGRGRR